MLKTTNLFICILLICHFSFSQTKRTEMNGLIINHFSRGLVNSHIVNLTTNKGTISDKNGEFTIQAKKGDWIQITNIQFIGKKIRVTNSSFKARFLRVYLLPKTNLLEEVEIRKKLKGHLSLDRIEKEKDTLPKVDKKYYDFSTMDFSIKSPLFKPLVSEKLADPTMNNAPITIAKVKFGGTSNKKKAVRKKIKFKEKLPKEFIKIFGEHFFFGRLKIPKEKYYHFIDYCTSFGIEQLYKDKKHLDILKILLKASKSYLQFIEKSK